MWKLNENSVKFWTFNNATPSHPVDALSQSGSDFYFLELITHCKLKMALILCFETQLHTFSPKMNYSVRAFLSPGNARVWSIKATMRPDQGPRKSTLVKAPTTWCVIAKAMKKWLKSGPRVDIIKRPDKIIEIFIIRDLPPIDYFKLVYQCQNVENILVWISKTIRWTEHTTSSESSFVNCTGCKECSVQ